MGWGGVLHLPPPKDGIIDVDLMTVRDAMPCMIVQREDGIRKLRHAWGRFEHYGNIPAQKDIDMADDGKYSNIIV